LIPESKTAGAKSFTVLRRLMTVIAIPPLLPLGEDGNRDHYAGQGEHTGLPASMRVTENPSHYQQPVWTFF